MTNGKESDPGRRLLRAAAAPTPNCVPIERLGEPLTVAQQVHVASCARCQTELALRAEFEDAIPTENEGLAVQWMAADLRRRRGDEIPARPVWIRTQTRALVAAAAGIVLVASVGYLMWDREPIVRRPSLSAPLERGVRIDALVPTGDVAHAPAAFSWAPVDGAATYELTVMEVDRSVLWRESSSVSRVTPPATLAARLVPGKAVLWEVTARNAAGSVIAESGTVRIRVITLPAETHMVRNPLTPSVIVAIGIATSVIVLTAAASSTFLSLAVSDESAPPGAIVQVKISVTEPKPISTGRGRLSGVSKVAGISLRSRLNDAYGVAVVDGSGLELSVRSPASSFGTDLDYPVVTVAAQVPTAMAMGSTSPVELEVGSLRLLDPTGAVYPTEAKAGTITARPGVWVGDIVPGSADLPAGAVVSIRGGGFRPGMRVRFDEVPLAAVRYISSSEVRVVLAQATRMHGRRVRVDNPDGTKTTYYSYQRTSRVTPSTRPVLVSAVPLFPYRFATTAQITAGSGLTGLALQNLQPVTVSFAIDVFRPDRSLARRVVGSLPANRYFVREISEILGQAYGPGWIVRVHAASPVQVMGVTVDAAGDASPILPR